MDDKVTLGAYEAPQVVDYGDLQELTAACLGGSGGDLGYPAQSPGTPSAQATPRLAASPALI